MNKRINFKFKTLFILSLMSLLINMFLPSQSSAATYGPKMPIPTYVYSNSSSNVYVLPNSSSMVVGSIGVERVGVYWQEGSYYYIEYVVSGGAYGGYKRGYVPTSKINVSEIGTNPYYLKTGKTHANRTVYNRPYTNSYVIGTVYSTDNIKILQEDGDMFYIEYPITNGYKRGYVFRTDTKLTGQTYSGQPVYEGDYVHCNRLNGPQSDHHYWSWSDSTKALADFVGSDCDLNLITWGCPLPPQPDYICDGLNVEWGGFTDCSLAEGWPVTVWWRN